MKAQIAIEYMTILIVLFTGLLIVSAIGAQRTSSVKTTEDKMKVSCILDDVAKRINTVYLEGPGFRTNITLPDTIYGFNYSLDLKNGVPIIYFKNQTFSSYPIPWNVSGNLSKGTNLIENINNQIVVSSI